ncbi:MULTISPECIES: NifU family protein [unclassified Lentimicrobium]|uniref:NifU family protein n=1 Tax=unclassified Lentimicrobium TaxID=2677434 RepID=UPI0015575BFD|nr:MULTISPECIES: NifU family protein [unclassified Lentimicrobium]NPD44888.1 NifU family protein [Lentimicrobium sp. S6]NPD83714.1 NifU family protein [Lentimicrobium sp. L6]
MASNKADLERKVQGIIEQIRPYLQNDGGDIKFIEITDENIVNVELLGACGSCPYSTMTLKNGVEEAVKKALPEIKSVEAINVGM